MSECKECSLVRVVRLFLAKKVPIGDLRKAVKEKEKENKNEKLVRKN